MLARVHEQTALAGLIAIGVHGATLLARPVAAPGRVGRARARSPWATGPLFTGLGIIAGYLAALLGLSFYARRRIGAKLWRKLHRATVLVWALGVRPRDRRGHGRGLALAAHVHGRDRRPDRRRCSRSGSLRRPQPQRVGRAPGARGGAGMSDGIVIAGGGLAAQRCTETLRAQGYDGPIRIVCGEPHPPYDRPPLSKELLTGELPAAARAAAAGVVRGAAASTCCSGPAPRGSTRRAASSSSRGAARCASTPC